MMKIELLKASAKKLSKKIPVSHAFAKRFGLAGPDAQAT